MSGYAYDVFISYSHHDRMWVRGVLVPRLERIGLRVCIDYRDFIPGAPSIREIERAVAQSRRTLIVLTPAYLDGAWTELEYLIVQTADPANRYRRLIPVIKERCVLPSTLQILTYVDLTVDGDPKMSWHRLAKALSPDLDSDELTINSGEDEFLSVVMESVQAASGKVDLSFTAFNLSPSLLVIADVVAFTMYFKVIQEPGLVAYSGTRRTGLKFSVSQAQLKGDLQWASLSIPYNDLIAATRLMAGTGDGNASSGLEKYLPRRTSMLAPTRAVHIHPGMAESFTVSVVDDSNSDFGFACMLALGMVISKPGLQEPIESRLHDVIEVSRDPGQKKIDVVLHTSESVEPFHLLYEGGSMESLENTVQRLVGELANCRFSPAVVHDAIRQIPGNVSDDVVAQLIRLLQKMDSSSSPYRRSAWLRSLEKVSRLASESLTRSHIDLWRKGLDMAYQTESKTDRMHAIECIEVISRRRFLERWPDSEWWLAVSWFSGLVVAVVMWPAGGSMWSRLGIGMLWFLGTVLAINATLLPILGSIFRRHLMSAYEKAIQWIQEHG